MRCFIRIKDGLPSEHPMLEENFRQAFPGIDVENLPNDFARFVRVDVPRIGAYQVYLGTTYEWQNDVVTDVHHVREMTEQERQTKQAETKLAWEQNGFASWVFNELACLYEPPTPYPSDGKLYVWDEGITDWVEVASTSQN